MADVKQAVQDQFGKVADNYRTSAVHAAGEDLREIARLVAGSESPLVLDAGCGAGHTTMAVAPHSARVVALDFTAAMLEQVERLASERGFANVETRLGDVEQMPFPDAAFDIVASRYSAHHWQHPQIALHEIRRVLKPGGRFILSDIVAPEEPAQDTFLQTLELLRDTSHVRDHTVSQWTAMLANAGFTSSVVFTWNVDLEFDSWVKRMATPDLNVAMLKALYDGASAEIRQTFNIRADYLFAIPGALFEAKVI